MLILFKGHRDKLIILNNLYSYQTKDFNQIKPSTKRLDYLSTQLFKKSNNSKNGQMIHYFISINTHGAVRFSKWFLDYTQEQKRELANKAFAIVAPRDLTACKFINVRHCYILTFRPLMGNLYIKGIKTFSLSFVVINLIIH